MTVAEEKMAACADHPERREIFELERLLDESDYPYYFNYREDLRPTPFGQMPDDAINWDSYIFLIEVGRLAGKDLAELSITFSTSGDNEKLELLDMRCAREIENPSAKDGEMSYGLTAETCFEIIKSYYEAM